MDTQTVSPPKPVRRWLRFGVRGLLVLVLAASLPLGWVAAELRQERAQKQAVQEIRDLEGTAMECPHFELEDSWVPDWMQERLADGKFARVNYVSLHGAEVTDTSLPRLCVFPQLRALVLRNCPVTDAGLACLRTLPQLETLSLSGLNITDGAMEYIRQLSHLQSLDLGSTKVTDAALVEIVGLQALVNLDLEHTQVTDHGLQRLASLPNLERLNLGDTHVTDAAVAELQRAAPHLKIER